MSTTTNRGPVVQPSWLGSKVDGEPVHGWRRLPEDHVNAYMVVTDRGYYEFTSDGLCMVASVLWEVGDERLARQEGHQHSDGSWLRLS